MSLPDSSRRSVPKFHRPEFYRYVVAEPRRFRFMLNRYGWQVIGVVCVLGRFAYCVKWAWAR